MSSDPGPSPLPRVDMHPVDDLHADTVAAVADRTEVATSFAELIYRESEVDALWSLVDIQVRQAEVNGSPELARWLQIRDLLWQAHDLIPEGRVVESAAVLRSLIPLL